MQKTRLLAAATLVILLVFFTGCTESPVTSEPAAVETPVQTAEPTPAQTPPTVAPAEPASPFPDALPLGSVKN